MQFLRERFIIVEDDWYPCYEGNKVKLRLNLIAYGKYYVKIAAWGADDTAYEQEFEYYNYEEARSKYDSLIPFLKLSLTVLIKNGLLIVVS